MKIALIALLLVPLSFAASWQEMSVLAVFISLMILGLLYAIGHAFEANELKFLAKEELAQLAVTMLMVGAVAIFAATYSGYPAGASEAIGETTATLTDLNSKLGSVAMDVGEQGSKNIMCAFQVVSFGVSTCSGYRMLAPVISAGFQLTSTTLAELGAMKFLMDSSQTWIISLLLPLGVFLRTFKYARGAGNLLISTGVAFYLILPIAYTSIREMVDGVRPSLGISDIGSVSVDVEDCNEYEIAETTNEDSAMSTFNSAMGAMDSILFYALIETTLTIVVSLAIAVISIRYLMKIAGTELDVQALGRLI